MATDAELVDNAGKTTDTTSRQLIDCVFSALGDAESSPAAQPRPTPTPRRRHSSGCGVSHDYGVSRPSQDPPKPTEQPAVVVQRTIVLPEARCRSAYRGPTVHDNRPTWFDWTLRAVMLGCFVAAAYFAFGAIRGTPGGGQPPVAVQPAAPKLLTKDIALVEVGEKVLGRNPIREQVDETIAEPDWATWRKLNLYMVKSNGKLLEIDLLRPPVWIEALGAKVGATIELNMPEMGAVGRAVVADLGPCSEIEDGPGNVVTGKFTHESEGNLVNLRLEDTDEITGVTESHPYWSEDRGRFVPAGELRPGERVRTAFGTTRVVSVAPRPADELVYNLEVHGEHVFQVTKLGVLVHNQCLLPADMVTLNLDITYCRAGKKVGLAARDSCVYVLRNKRTGELLKVGETANWAERFKEYRRITRRSHYELEVDVFRTKGVDTKKQRRALETQIRKQLKDLGHKLPWDATRSKSGHPGRGTPYF